MNDLLVLAAIGIVGGMLIGPPLGYWSVRWEDALEKHRRHCLSCQHRTARQALRRRRRRPGGVR